MKKGTYDPEKHHRRSIRLKRHDYAGGGLYFITLCAHRDAGNIFAHEKAKEILSRIWEEICADALENGAGEGRTQGAPVRAGLVSALPSEPKAYCIMPDHFHGLIEIRKGEKALGAFICAFKSRTTHEFIQGVKAGELPRFPGKIWHRNYYEMIVRSAEAEAKISHYIRMNPWRCVQELGNGLCGMGNPALWNAEKLGVLCSRNAPRPKSIPKAAVYLGGFHSPMEQEIFLKLLEHKRPVIWCPAWGLERAAFAPGAREALEQNRMLILEMRDTAGNLAAAEARNRFVLKHADQRWIPHVQSGGMLDRLLREG
jgi:REP element-mobilizing transposase RayT